MATPDEQHYSPIDVNKAVEAIEDHKKVTVIKPTSLNFLKDKYNLILIAAIVIFIISLVLWLSVAL